MSKPYEETLTAVQFDRERRCLIEGGARMVAVLRNYESSEWETFLAAAPAMARALLEAWVALKALPNEVITDAMAEAQGSIGVALTNAGVPLP